MRKKLIWATLLIPLLVSLFAMSVTTAPAATNILMDPPVIWDPDMAIGTEFTVDVIVDDVFRAAAWQIELGEEDFGIPGWDPDVLMCLGVELGPFLGSAGGNVVWYPGDINNGLGTLGLSVAVLDPARRFPSGGGVLCTLTFQKVGHGATLIYFGKDTGMLDYRNVWVVRGTINPDAIHDGFFANIEGPELSFQHGVSGIWEEYQTILEGETQTSYALVRNWGPIGAWIEVDFVIIGPEGVATYPSDPVWVDPRHIDPDTGKYVPGEGTASVSYIPGPPKFYWAYAVLYFKASLMEEMIPYAYVEGTLGGEATTKPTNTAFQVKTH